MTSDARVGVGRWLPIVAGALVPLLVFATRLGDNFVSDDFDLLHWAIARSFIDGLAHPPWTTWLRPATDTLWQATAWLFGTAPVGHHLVNLALHVANATLVGLLASRYVSARIASFAAAAFFATGPTAASVAQWLSCRYDLLAALFSLLALHLALTCGQRWRSSLAAGSVACAVLALFSKEAAVGLPLIACACASRRLNAWTGDGRVAPIPRRLALAFLALLPVYFAIRWTLFGGLGGYGSHASLAVAQLLNPLLCLPLASVPVYVRTPFDGMSLYPWLLAAVVSAVVLAWRAPVLAVAYLAAFMPIVNMMGTLGFVTDDVQRLMYLPSTMVAASVGVVAAAVHARVPRLAHAALVAVLIVSLAGTWHRLTAWREAATVTSAVASTLRSAKPTMPLPALVDCLALPDNIRGAWVYRTGCDTQVRLVLGEAAARGTRGDDGPYLARDTFASTWCLSADGTTITPGLCRRQ